MTERPPGAVREAAPDETPRADSKSVAQTTYHVTSDPFGSHVDTTTAVDFKIGDRVVTLPTVRPAPYAGKSGTIAALNVRDNEIGVWLGNWCSGNHVTTWFRPRELSAVTTARRAPVPPSSVVLSTELPEHAP